MPWTRVAYWKGRVGAKVTGERIKRGKKQVRITFENRGRNGWYLSKWVNEKDVEYDWKYTPSMFVKLWRSIFNK